MKKRLMFFGVLVVLLFVASPAFAAEAAGGGGDSVKQWGIITSGFAMAIASGLCGLAQGRATAAAAEGMARNPGSAAAIRFALILGLALIESLALYTLVIIFAKIPALS